MHYHLLGHQGGAETQTRKATVMTPLEGSSRYKCIRKPLLHNKDITRLKTCNKVFEIEHFSRLKTDTSIRVIADNVNFVMNPEYVYCT